VPEIIRLNFEGNLPPGVFAKDIILHAIGKLGADYAVYKGVEIGGSAIAKLSVSERMPICNMTTEMVPRRLHPADAVTMEFQQRKRQPPTRSTRPIRASHARSILRRHRPQAPARASFSVDNVFDLKSSWQ
jgi:3-isopropylmalate/(R)-2-methylmalate dehydratase large subunit